MQLKQRIVHRIEEFDEQVLMFALFHYLLHQQPFEPESLPKIDAETFQKVCNSMLDSNDKVDKIIFENMFQLVTSRQDIEMLANLVLMMVIENDGR